MSIHEPFLLQSYSNSRRFQNAKALVYASYTSTTHSSDGFVTVAAQGDGIHLLDVSSLHSIVSHTLGPSTTFSCPPVMQPSPDGQTYSSYVGIASSSDLSQGETNQTIWAWKDTPSASTSAVQQKQSVTLPHDVYGLHTLSQILVAVSTGGSISVLDSELNIRETKNASPSAFSVTHTFCFPNKEGNFSSAGLASLILVESSKSASRIRALFVAEDNSIQDLGTCSIPLSQAVSCNPSGFLTLLCAPCTLHSYQIALSPTSSNIQVSPLAPPVHLSPLCSISLLALHSSFVLLCGIAQKKVTLLIWDMRFSVVLASHTFDVPEGSDTTSLIASSKEHPTEAILVISSSPSSSPAKTSIFIVPLSVASSSTIALAMGRAVATAPWLNQNEGPGVQFDSKKKKLLSDMQAAMESRRPQSASQTFFAWEKDEKKSGTHISYGHSFVKELLNVVLQPAKPANFPYSSDVVRHLLELGVVSASMVDAGLLNVLRIRNDWTSIRISLKKVTDLLEVDIIDCLRHVVEYEAPSNAMQVDGPAADAPTLPDFLRLCVSYTCSPVALKTALRRCLPAPGSLTRVLEVLDSWLGQWPGRDVSLLPPKKALDKNAHGVYVVNLSSCSTGDLPSINEIASFIQAILDSSLLVILQHAPAHHVLRRISRRVETEICVVDETEQLRGPLEAFVKAQANTLKVSEQGKEQLADWRQRSKFAHDQAVGAMMVYQIEHLVL